MKNEHIQLLNAGSEHWLFTFCSNGKIQICDSLKPSLSRVNRKCVHALYKNCVKEFIVSFLPVQKQTDGYNCGSSAIAFEAEIVDGKSPVEACFDVERMRGHLINCLEKNFSYHSQKFDLIYVHIEQCFTGSTPMVEKLLKYL